MKTNPSSLVHGNAVSRVNRSGELRVHSFSSNATTAERQLLPLTVAEWWGPAPGGQREAAGSKHLSSEPFGLFHLRTDNAQKLPSDFHIPVIESHAHIYTQIIIFKMLCKFFLVIWSISLLFYDPTCFYPCIYLWVGYCLFLVLTQGRTNLDPIR